MAVELEEGITASKIDISRFRGDGQVITFIVKNSKNKPINLQGWTDLTLTVDPSAAPIDNTTKISTMIGQLSTNGLDGRISILVDQAIPPGNYYYDMQAADTDGRPVTLAYGKYTVIQDITKD